jgi:hypothetical protein
MAPVAVVVCPVAGLTVAFPLDVGVQLIPPGETRTTLFEASYAVAVSWMFEPRATDGV